MCLTGFSLTGCSAQIPWHLIKKRTRPPIVLEIRSYSRGLWKYFRDYHYLNKQLYNQCECYTALYNKKPVAFIAMAKNFGAHYFYRVSRVVVLPDYQGIGVATAFLNWIGSYYTKVGKKPIYIVTSNPQLVKNRNMHWRLQRLGHASGHTFKGLRKSVSKNRITATLKYVP